MMSGQTVDSSGNMASHSKDHKFAFSMTIM